MTTRRAHGQPLRGAQARGRPQVRKRGGRRCGCLCAFAEEHGASLLEELTPALLDDFLASRPRPRPRSFNHLLGVVRCLLDWAVAHELLEASPLQARRASGNGDADPVPLRHRPGATAARRGRRAPGSTHKPPNAERPTARSSRSATGSGLRVGEACALRVGDVDRTRGCSSSSAASSARVDWFRTARASASSSPSS